MTRKTIFFTSKAEDHGPFYIGRSLRQARKEEDGTITFAFFLSSRQDAAEMSIATVNQLYNYTTSRDQHAFLPVLTTYIETDHKWQDIPPTTNQQGSNVAQTTFNIPTTLGELLGTMILHFNIVISSGTLPVA